MAHIPGVKNRAPDTLSRHPQNPPKMVLHDDIHGIQDGTTAPTLHIPTQLMAGICTEDQLYSLEVELLHSTHTVNWEEVQIATSSDEHMLLLLSTIEDGIPEQRHQLPAAIREYHQFRKHLYSTDGVVIYKDRIVIPPSLCLSALHAAHQGTSAMTSKAEASGLATSKPPEPIAHNATGWPHHKRHYHQRHRCSQSTPYVQTTSITRAAITW